MTYRVLFGTTNQAKLEIVRAYLDGLPIELLGPNDLNIDIRVEEDGASTAENARKKAAAYFSAGGIHTLAIDAGLTVDGFPPEKQPGVFVRRIFGANQEASDQQMLDYYAREVERLGGQCLARWHISTAFAVSLEQTLVDTFSFEALMLARRSPKLLPGAPLSSLMVNPSTGKYFSEVDHLERADSAWIKSVMEQHLLRWMQAPEARQAAE